MNNKIIARNLTARAAYNVPGNPPSTRLESGVANCYPGLEYDHRNLDRRFFPGLVFEFVSQEDATAPHPVRQGAWLRSVDGDDPALASPPEGFQEVAAALESDLSGDVGTSLGSPGSRWFLETIEQDERRIRTVDGNDAPLDGLVVWRLVRSLRPGRVTLTLKRREPAGTSAVTLRGWRRRFTDNETGVIDAAFAPGELTQSLCSPWMHDFRDCGCTYWASNHPDIVLPAAPLEDAALPSGAPDQAFRGDMPVDWLRSDREFSASAAVGAASSRAAQMSHFEINRRWEDLAVVLEGREIGDFYVPRSRQLDNARPYASATELRDQLVALAGLEHLVALLYLYARYSVLSKDQVSGTKLAYLAEDVEFSRHVLLEVAVSEMQHLRWANQILWGLYSAGVVPGWDAFTPAVVPPALEIPAAGRLPPTPAALAPLTPETMALFVAIEEPSGFIDGRYARVTATLMREEYPSQLHELAATIVRDGEQHYLHFRDMQKVLSIYNAETYLRKVIPGDPKDAKVATALTSYQEITASLLIGYQRGDLNNMKSLAKARAQMFALDEQAEALAKENVGVPYLSLFGPMTGAPERHGSKHGPRA